MKASKLREKSREELVEDLRQQRDGLLRQRRMKSAGGEAESPIHKRTRRRDVARILTVLRERELNDGGRNQ
jgi:large subunit ribosomal protein L29